MLSQFRIVWDFLGEVVSAIPSDITSVVSYVFVGIGIIGILRSL